MYYREKYCKAVLEARNHHRLILLSGIRFSGKKETLGEIARRLRQDKPPVRIVHIHEGSQCPNGTALLQEARSLGVGASALLIDCADSIESLIPALSRILETTGASIVLTGTRTSRLESALSENFPKECAVIRMRPFTYAEFLFSGNLSDTRETYERYLDLGGMTEALFPQSLASGELLPLVADSLILRDIIENNPVRNAAHIRALLELIAANPGQSLSARDISRHFSSRSLTISPQSALDYLVLCGKSRIVESIPLFDILKGRELDTSRVWYFADTGLMDVFVPDRSRAVREGKIETLVYLTLADEGWTIRRGRMERGSGMREDITFVCEREGKKAYIQYIPPSAGMSRMKQASKALLSVRDAWPKIIVGMNETSQSDSGLWNISERELILHGLTLLEI